MQRAQHEGETLKANNERQPVHRNSENHAQITQKGKWRITQYKKTNCGRLMKTNENLCTGKWGNGDLEIQMRKIKRVLIWIWVGPPVRDYRSMGQR